MNDLIQKLESYNFVDELGHPLVNCVEWEELKEKLKRMVDLQPKCNYSPEIKMFMVPESGEGEIIRII